MRYERTLLIALLLMVAAPRLAFVLRETEGIVAAPIVDDGFYNMTVARNLAAGRGFTFDGTETTTGFHPLVILIAAPVFWATDGGTTVPLRIILSIYTALSVLLAWMLYRVVRRLGGPGPALVALVMFATSPIAGIFLNTMNGCDTVIGGVLLIATTWYYLAHLRDTPNAPRGRYVILGLLAGSLGLARLDLGFFAAALGVELLIRRRPVGALATYAAAGLVAIAPWIAFNVAMTGRPLPDNGRAVTMISRATADIEVRLGERGLFRTLSGGAPAFDDAAEPYPDDRPPTAFYTTMLGHATLSLANEMPVTGLPVAATNALVAAAEGAGVGSKSLRSFQRTGAPLYLAVAIAVLLAGGFIVRFHRIRESRLLDGVGWLVAGGALVFFAYPLVVFGQWFFGRYYFPPVLVGLVMTPAIAMAVAHRWRRRAVALIIALFAAPFLAHSIPSLIDPVPRPFYRQARQIADRLPPTFVVGAIQAGHFGFFCPQRIVNLDGKVSSAAHKALRERRVLEYARGEGVNVITEWPSLMSLMIIKRSANENAARLRRVDPPPNQPAKMNGYGWVTYLYEP